MRLSAFKARWLWALTMLLGSQAAAAAPPVAVTFPGYETVRNIDDYATAEAYRAAVADPAFVMERVTYPSDGLEVYAYVYRPVAPTKRMPVIIFNRGSYTWPSFSAELVTMAHRLGQRGYLVIAPMYRGSGGAQGRDEMGGDDLDDLFNLLPVVRSLTYADPDQLYLYGESRGGMMVYQALRDGFPARAAAVVGGFTDLETMLQEPRWAEAGASIWPELATDRAKIVDRRSAIHWAEKINIPVLILHGARDRSVAPSHALDLAQRLSDLGKQFELHVVEGEGHVLSSRTEDRDKWVVDWFERHAEAPAKVAPQP